MPNTHDIPQVWVKEYIDQMLVIAEKFLEGGVMQQAAMLRADHAMDLVKSWREKT